MDFKWISNGPQMDLKWISNESQMNLKWVSNGSQNRMLKEHLLVMLFCDFVIYSHIWHVPFHQPFHTHDHVMLCCVM